MSPARGCNSVLPQHCVAYRLSFIGHRRAAVSRTRVVFSWVCRSLRGSCEVRVGSSSSLASCEPRLPGRRSRSLCDKGTPTGENTFCVCALAGSSAGLSGWIALLSLCLPFPLTLYFYGSAFCFSIGGNIFLWLLPYRVIWRVIIFTHFES